ncbi:MFS transporter [Saccharopolyspora sp. 5N102]|uniref:MFS transporter n=1 Tax=Saccharopolyspora sp. 5N102 TaxID=3375155 RepID=UPI00379104C3
MQQDIAAPAAAHLPLWQRRPGVSFAVFGTVQITLIAAMTLISVLLPAIQRDLGLDRAELALANNAYAVSFCGLLLLSGRLGDLLGLRRALVVGMVVFGLASVANTAATSFAVMLLARFGQGIGAALTAPAAMALAGIVFRDPQRRARAIAIWGGLPVVGATSGILLSGVVANWVSWRWAFVVPAAVVGLVLVLLPRVMPPAPETRRIRVDVLGAVLVTAGLCGVCYGLVEAAEQGWAAAGVLVPLLAGLVALGSFTLWAARAEHPLVPLSFFRSRKRLMGLLGVMLASSGTFTTTYFLPLYFQQQQAFSPLMTSIAFLPYGIAMLATGLFAGWLAVTAGARRMTAIGFAVGAAGLALLGQLDVASPYVGTLLAGLVVFPVGAALIFSAATAAAMDDVPDEQAGLAGGVLNTAMEGGPTIGFALLVSIAGAHTSRLTGGGTDAAVATADGYGFAFTIAAAAYVAAIALSLLTLRRR